ncbi:hypothetical protein N802_05660 [Knoellia sinensis KCTC 19936]|uniref:Glucose-6-phosphate 1-dehydrogenase n=1 Tax=Knoellia sinensis KCTC 19936 TaxID=1385520 RepID=A0A0A0J432_9MICO|nr:hypothetical protein [Knoellia sinensis]KGN30882.1 hypothetical protein N802_05660 [Knoellia sinensis KCTC 19936]
MITNLLLFGATGDLASDLLLPALAALRATGRIGDDFTVIGTARDDMDTKAFREHAAQSLEENASHIPIEHREALTQSLRYQAGDATKAEDVAALVREAGDGPLVAYLALPPALFIPCITALAAADLSAGSRVALEKPFGEDLDSAVELNRVLAGLLGSADDEAAYRIDHALGMSTVRNLLDLRLNDPFLAAIWDAQHIERVDVLWEEDDPLEGRAGYYDSAGALKDVVQNHMLRVLAVVAMEPPAGPGEQEVKEAKVDALRAARAPQGDDAASRTRRARWAAGRLGDADVPAYVDEEGVDPSRETETFAEVVLEIDTPRWRGTSFVLRAGKALRVRRKEVVVHLRPLRPDGPPGRLDIGIDGPTDITLTLQGSEPIILTGTPPASLPPYAHVLLDLLQGGSALAVSSGGAEESWRLMEPVLAAWSEGRVPLVEYPAGSDGPPRLLG